MAKKNKQPVQIDPATLDTYFKQRMYQLGIIDTSLYGFTLESSEYPGSKSFYPFFAETGTGNIQINYPCLYGGPEFIQGTEREFVRVRINQENQRDNSIKYYQEKGTGIHIFHTPAVLKKFATKTKIPTLYLVEGEFKAFAGYLAGIDIVGIGGKDLFKDGEGDLHEDIQAIIKNCDVENLVLLLDADIFSLEWNIEDDPNKDLSKRLYGFYNSVKTFREVSKGKVKDAYFSHIKESYVKEAKGLDDLLALKGIDQKKVAEDLQQLTAAKAFFYCRNLSGDSINKLKAYFLLTYTKNIPDAFYRRFDDLIGDNEFNFGGSRFQNTKSDGLKMVKHEESFHYMRVGTDYFKEGMVPNSKGILEKRRTVWKKGEITMDYVQKGFTNFFDTIPKYYAFCNVPDNTDTYQEVINDCKNLYYRLDHELAEGEWPNIKKYLVHVFGEEKIGGGETTNLDLALDCIQLKYLQPTQMLPILCLVGRQRNTGKSTFLWLMRAIFLENATVIGNQEINDQYNDDWASKLIIGIDESFIEKKIVLEKIKSQSTNDRINLRGMYSGRQPVSFFGWFIMTSNDEDNFIPIDKEEVRFWVNRVPAYQEEDPHLIRKMTEEIPYFLHFLKHRKIMHPQTGRFWFAKELMENEALRKLKENAKGWFAQELTEIIIDKFDHYKWHTVYYTLGEIYDMLNGPNSGIRFRKGDIKKQLQDKFNLYSANNRWQHPTDPDKRLLTPTEEKQGRCYEFRIENFMTEEQIRNEFSEFFNYDEVKASRTEGPIAFKKKDDLPF